MTKPLSVSEARDKLAEVIVQVQYGGARVTISRRGKPLSAAARLLYDMLVAQKTVL